jgi:hypothetical protein
MPRCICKINDRGKDYFFIWSTVVDAPVTPMMVEKDFLRLIKDSYWRDSVSSQDWTIDSAMQKVQETGMSWRNAYGITLDSMLQGNRAGYREQSLTKIELIFWYIRRNQTPKPVKRKRIRDLRKAANRD